MELSFILGLLSEKNLIQALHERRKSRDFRPAGPYAVAARHRGGGADRVPLADTGHGERVELAVAEGPELS
jgi:hypothetical protein